MSNDLRADLTADLLSDLGRAAPLPSAPPAPSPLPAAPAPASTPAVVVTLTPLHWSLPRLDAPDRGIGVAASVGPWRVEVAF